MTLFSWLTVYMVWNSIVISFGGRMDLTLLSDTLEGSKCLDGSQAGYYYEAPQYGDTNLWVIYLIGGGACYTEDSCRYRTNTSLGSSDLMPRRIFSYSLFDTDPELNPFFYQGHHVQIPYCTGDLYIGQRTQQTINETWGFYFDGHLVVENIITELINNYDLSSAEQVLVAGSSAGGIGTILNLDFIANKLKALNPDMIIKGMAADGWFFPGNTTDQYDSEPLNPPSDYASWLQDETGGDGPWYIDGNVNLWNSYLHPDCVQAMGDTEAFRCMSAHTLYPFIETPIFITQDQFDTNQIETQLGLPSQKQVNKINNDTVNYVRYFGKNMLRSLMQIKNNDDDALFMASCYQHGFGSFAGKIVNGYNVTQQIGEWYFEIGDNFNRIVIDDCGKDYGIKGLPCNPSCSSENPYWSIISDSKLPSTTSTMTIPTSDETNATSPITSTGDSPEESGGVAIVLLYSFVSTFLVIVL